MCLITIETDKKLSEADFKKAFDKNNDGVGFGWFKDDKACFKKGFMDLKEAYLFHESLTLPFVTHFRKKSIGEVCKELTHPFIVSKESPLDLEGETTNNLLFMNGSASWWEEFLNATGRYKESNELFSDARALAIVISNNNERFLRKVSAKFVVMDTAKSKFYYYGDFKEDDGILFSNKEWQYSSCVVKKNVENIGNSGIMTKNQTGIRFGTNHKKTNYSYDKPWESTNDQKHRVLRYLLNKITPNAGKKLWNRYQKRQILEDALEKAIKILKQQNKEFDSNKEIRIRHFITADKLIFPYSTNYLINHGVKTLNLWEDSNSDDKPTEEQKEQEKEMENKIILLNEFNRPIESET